MFYTNEPTVQKLPPFVNFMGGMGFVNQYQTLRKLTARPRHWRGTVEVKKRGALHTQDVPVTVYTDGVLVHCNHAKQSLEVVQVNAGLDTEYNITLSVCAGCGNGWDEDGELRMEPQQ